METLIAAIAALAGVWLGSNMQANAVREERKSLYIQGHNGRVADALGGLLLLMAVLRPDSLAMDLPESHSRDRFSSAVEESDPLIRQLAVATASHPLEEIRAATNSVLVNVNQSIGDVGLMLLLIDQGEADKARGDARSEALVSWDAANATIEETISLLHSERDESFLTATRRRLTGMRSKSD